MSSTRISAICAPTSRRRCGPTCATPASSTRARRCPSPHRFRSREMIFRKWTGRIRTADADTYIQYIRDTGGDEYAATDGNLGYQILLRDLGDGSSEVSTVS